MRRCEEVVAVGGAVRGGAALAIFALAALVTHAGSTHAALYKWVDEHGEVHYSDKVPPEAVNKGNVELNKQAIPIKKTEPALTPEQLKAKAAEDERQRQAAKQQEEINRRDRALLASYTSENEIDLARARAMQTIDNVLQSTQAYMAQLVKRRDGLLAKKAAAARKGAGQRRARARDAEWRDRAPGRSRGAEEARSRDGDRQVRQGQAALARARRREVSRRPSP